MIGLKSNSPASKSASLPPWEPWANAAGLKEIGRASKPRRMSFERKRDDMNDDPRRNTVELGGHPD